MKWGGTLKSVMGMMYMGWVYLRRIEWIWGERGNGGMNAQMMFAEFLVRNLLDGGYQH